MEILRDLPPLFGTGITLLLEQGLFNYLFGGHQTMQTYGKFEGFPFLIVPCLGWIGNIMTLSVECGILEWLCD